MSSIAADPGDFAEVPRSRRWGVRIKNRARLIGSTIKRYASKTWAGAKYTSVLAAHSVVFTARAALSFVGRVLAGVGWLVSAAVWVVGLAVTLLVGLIVTAVIAAGLGITYPVSRAVDWWNLNVISVPAYFLKKRTVSFKKYKEERDLTQRFSGISRVENFFGFFKSRIPSMPNSTLLAKAQQYAEEDLADPVAAFDGLDVVPNGDQSVTVVRTGIDLVDALDQVADPTQFDFTPFVNVEKFEFVLESLRLNAKSNEEQAYWIGRLETYRNRDMEGAKVWALINKRYQSRQSQFPIKLLRAGHKDMLSELTAVGGRVRPTPTPPKKRSSSS